MRQAQYIYNLHLPRQYSLFIIYNQRNIVSVGYVFKCAVAKCD